ncbi:hypothetical protein [Amnibacterium kyonggiense]
MKPLLVSRRVRPHVVLLAVLAVVAVVVGIGVWVTRPVVGVLHASESPAVLLVVPESPEIDDQVAFLGTSFTLNARGCVQWGSSVVVGQPGSSISSDGRRATFALSNGRTETFAIGRRVESRIGGSVSGGRVQGIPEAATTCGRGVGYILVQ